MAEYDDIVGWLTDNPDKTGTPEYVQKADRFRQLDQAATNKPIKQVNAGVPEWVRRPEADIRAGVAAMDPGIRRDNAYTAWGQGKVALEEEQARGAPANRFARRGADVAGAVASGIPGGSFLDEIA